MSMMYKPKTESKALKWFIRVMEVVAAILLLLLIVSVGVYCFALIYAYPDAIVTIAKICTGLTISLAVLGWLPILFRFIYEMIGILRLLNPDKRKAKENKS